MKLTKTSDPGMNYMRALVHGDSGIGKTTSLKTLLPHFKVEEVLVASGDRDVAPLKRIDFPALKFDSWQDVREIHRQFVDHPERVQDEGIAKAVKAARVLVIDRLSDVSELLAKHIVTVARPDMLGDRETKGKGRKEGDNIRTTPIGIYSGQLTLEDYGYYNTQIRNVVSAFCQLPIHIIMTSVSGWTKDKDASIVYRTVDMFGKAALQIPQHFGMVFNMQAATGEGGKPDRRWQTFNCGRVMAKDASGDLEPFEPANWTAVFEKFNSTKKETSK